MIFKRLGGCVCAAVLVTSAIAGVSLTPHAAMAQDKPVGAATDPQAKRQAEIESAYEAAVKAGTTGPADVALLKQAVLAVPSGYVFVPRSEGDRLMRAFGNQTGPQFLGLILPTDNGAWFATLDYNPAGYVRDDDAKSWKADELLQTLKDGTEASNDSRKERGFPPVELTGWVEPPAYTAETHRLVWAANLRLKGAASGGSVNYNTYALGREGYFELNMVGDGDTVRQEKGRVQELLANLTYVPGKAYGDFKPGTDRVAEYGLAALVAGVAAKKLGLLAVAGVFLLKIWKLVALAVVGGGALIGKLFGRSTKPPSE